MNMVGNDFDIYLSQLGFISPQLPSENTVAGGGFWQSDAPAINQTAQLSDWFSGNMHVMGLMEEDLLDFHPTL